MSIQDYYSSSPFRQHVGTNYAPSERELVQIDSFLQSPKRRLADVSAEIESVQRVLDELQTRKTALSKVIHAHEALKNPIRRLPREVLQEIFLHCLPTDHLPTLDNASAPLVLTRVCRAWRTLVQTTPALWSAVHIAIPGGSEEHHAFQQGRIEQCQARGPHAPFCAAILAHAFHIHTLSLAVPDRFLKIFTETPRPNADDPAWPLLHKVTLDRGMNGEYGHPIVSTTQLQLWKAPNLKYISWNALEGIEVTGDDQAQGAEEFDKAPWCEFSARETRSILHATPMLRTLKITIARHDELVRLGPGPHLASGMPKMLALQHLRKLNLTDTYIDPSTNPTVFMEDLQLPALEDLAYNLRNANLNNLDSPERFPPPGNPFLLRFLRAQRQPILIKKLRISATAASRKGFMECLRRMPLLEQLWVTSGTLPPRHDVDFEEEEKLNWYIRPDDDLLQAFTVETEAGSGEVLCPKLHSIRLDRSECSLEAVKTLVEHRNNLSGSIAMTPPYVPIRRLRLNLSSVPRPVFVPCQAKRLATCALEEELRELGIDITVEMKDQRGYHSAELWRNHLMRMQRYDPKEGLPHPNSRSLAFTTGSGGGSAGLRAGEPAEEGGDGAQKASVDFHNALELPPFGFA
ncbi:hypothetical protein NMY22_g9787 [Coprinellus aureogranulatus]|nr:hypothetical protein NMY22_g9787 [Coprinellus aureogranulatus]